MKKDKDKINTRILNQVIKRWKINIPMLCEQIQMPQSTFKLKLSATNTLYNFTAEEYQEVLTALGSMLNDIRQSVKKMEKHLSNLKATPKK